MNHLTALNGKLQGLNNESYNYLKKSRIANDAIITIK